MHELRLNGHRKWHVGWGYTARCNMACPFCYSRSARSATREPDASPDQARLFLRRNASEIDSINWGTGENTLCDSWWDLVHEIHETYPGIRQSLTTNGSLVLRLGHQQERATRLANCLNDLDVSIDFADGAQHNALRGHDGAFQMAVECLGFAARHGIPRSIVMLGIRETLQPDALDALFALAARFDANLRINVYRPVPGLALTPPAYETVRDALVHIVSHYRVVALSDPLFAVLFNRCAPDPSGVSSCRILPDGGITPSTYLVTAEWIAGHVTDITDMQKLSDTVPFRALRNGTLPDRCVGCRFVATCCGGAKDRRILQQGSLSRPDPYCPFENGDEAFLDRTPVPTYADPGVSLVHVGYLPTLVFKP